MRSKLLVITLSLMTAMSASAQDFSLGFTGRFDDNLGFARAEADIVEDISVQADASLSWHHAVSPRTSFDFQTGISLQHFTRTEDFDAATLNFSLSGNRKIGLGNGLSKPLVSLRGQLGRLQSEEEFRSGYPYGLELSARSRLANSALFSYRLSYSGFEPDKLYQVPVGVTQRGDAWRWQLLSVGASYAMPLTERLGLSLDVAGFEGDLVFSTVPTQSLNNFALARAPDHALGAAFYAYRVQGKAWQSSIALALIPTRGQQIQLKLGRLYSRSEADFGYDRTWLELGWSRSF